MPRLRHAVYALSALAILSPPAARAEDVESPAFRSWAKVRPGTVVVVRTTTATPAGTVESTEWSKLVAVADAGATVESWTRIKGAAGDVSEVPPSRYTVRRMVPVPKGVRKEDVGRAPDATSKGEEQVTLAGRTFKALWYDARGQTEVGESLSRSWISEDMPGLLLKAVTRVPKTGKVTTIELVEIDEPR